MYGIHESVYSKMINYFKNNDYIKKVILFGSRAKGNAEYNSDIDLAIDCDKRFRGTVVEDIEDIIGVYSSNIVFLDRAEGDIKHQIEIYGIELYSMK